MTQTPTPIADHWSGWWTDLRVAAGFLTRLPGLGAPIEANLARAMRAFPLIGAGLGLLAGLVYALGYGMGLPPMAAALLAIGCSVLVTGALHEDGLADTADGMAGGRDVETRLAIMADSRIGAAGTLALVIGVGLRAAALATLATPGVAAAALIAAGAGSRAIFPAFIHRLSPARPDGLGAMAGTPSSETSLIALGLGTLVIVLCVGITTGIAAIVAAMLGVAAIAVLAARKIGGYTGDVLGAAQQVAEIAILLVAAGALGSR
jgi:adenosylcobinamide-GDP ribazoletransferase